MPLARVDPEWAKRQITVMLREWYMHPNGQLAAYEWAFDDTNPPVHAWAALKVYRIAAEEQGRADTAFLERVFHKLLLNFTWWVNKKDRLGNNVFQGGFLGLDNIGVFDRSKPLPTGGYLEQADGTAWMAMYCLNMLTIALELARTRPAYEDVATKFFEHFVRIADAAHHLGDDNIALWDEADGFFYDVIHTDENRHIPVRVRSFVGLIPVMAVELIDTETLAALPRFRRRMEWTVRYRPDLVDRIAPCQRPGAEGHLLLSMLTRDMLERVLTRVFDPEQFLAAAGLRSVSKEHGEHPFRLHAGGAVHEVRYEPAESPTPMFGGNSNWRGPVWFPK